MGWESQNSVDSWEKALRGNSCSVCAGGRLDSFLILSTHWKGWKEATGGGSLEEGAPQPPLSECSAVLDSTLTWSHSLNGSLQKQSWLFQPLSGYPGLERQWVWEVCFGIRNELQKETQGAAAQFILTTTIHWKPSKHLWFPHLVTSSLLQLWSAFVMTPSPMFWGLPVYSGCKMKWAAAVSAYTCNKNYWYSPPLYCLW